MSAAKEEKTFPDFFVRALEGICAIAQEEGQSAYLVGGFVRDLLRGDLLLERDLDILIDGDARPVARAFARKEKARCVEHERFFTAKVSALHNFLPLEEIDFASSRKEIYERPGALPRVEIASLEEDLQRRDFSTNAMAIPLGETLACIQQERHSPQDFAAFCIDQFQGLADLESKTLRVLHEQSFLDDPTRLFRAARYLVRFDWTLEKRTAVLAQEAIEGGALASISPNRIFRECEKIFEEAHSAAILRKLQGWKLFDKALFFEGFALDEFIEDLAELDSRAAIQVSMKRELGRFACFARMPAGQRMDRFVPLGLGKKLLHAWAQELEGQELRNSSLYKLQ